MSTENITNFNSYIFGSIRVPISGNVTLSSPTHISLRVGILSQVSEDMCVRHARIQNILSEGGSKLSLKGGGGGGRIKIPLLAGSHQPASETPFKWRFAGVSMMAQH